jgi:hypothetical protein
MFRLHTVELSLSDMCDDLVIFPTDLSRDAGPIGSSPSKPSYCHPQKRFFIPHRL